MNEVKWGSYSFKTYFRPGLYLDDFNLKRLYRSIIEINNTSKKKVNIRYLQLEDIDEIKSFLSHIIVSIVHTRGKDISFLMNYIIEDGDVNILHVGIMIANSYTGNEAMAMMACFNKLEYFKQHKCFYTTNISATPAAIEAFDKISRKVWPSPKSQIKKPPKDYINVVKLLEEFYIKKWFQDPTECNIDPYRFVLKSPCKKMGFKTNMFQMSRANNIEYQNFCNSLIDYENEEDLVQVSTSGYLELIKTYLLTNLYLVFKKPPRFYEEEATIGDENDLSKIA
ncbi:hypothetical protein ABMA70_04070 [Halobacteriovorax sp. XZX-3]|uniref:hypothetical protein n=1 Tax=unclassified Halobacteriovorax TaxID=2639665 RepID=UPI000CD02DA6|nr:hypothetical protein [Halobacteriovorax sp. DA5]POB15317.1 hypothetical protein C0Z22_02710 [Halobacteriovorax sp. DA5]